MLIRSREERYPGVGAGVVAVNRTAILAHDRGLCAVSAKIFG
jgi:hypothetical protein